MYRGDFLTSGTATRRYASRLAGALAVFAVVFAAGCSEAPAKPAGQDAVQAQTDALADDLSLAEDADVWLLDLPDTVECPGAAGCLCQADDDCNSGLCTEAPDGKRCGVLCGAGCPAGTVCRTANTAGEPINYCAPVGVRQCAPCQTSADCNAPWSAPAVCASGGAAGSFCASSCVADSDCPAGLTCQQVDVSGGKQSACAPASGVASCTCSAWAIANQAKTSCGVSEGIQLCPGTRSCETEGLGPCNKTPGALCVEAGCKDAKAGSPCDDGDPCTQSECQAGSCTTTNNLCQCQGDNDCPDDANLCNGKPFCDKSQVPYVCKANPATLVTCPVPENPCETSTCNPGSGQCQSSSKPNGSVCDDGDPCTQSECQVGSCVVTDDDLCACKSTADCSDDGNLCNGKPFCDKSVAPYACKTNPGSVVSCPQPANACQVAACDPASGQCQLAAAPDLTPCSDGAACTVGDVCVAGVCTPGTVTCSCSTDADCAPYEDGNQCNGTLFCNKAAGKCQINPKTVVQCPSVNDTECQQNLCVPTTGACAMALAPTTTLCEDGNPCTASDHCEAGLCVSSTSVCVCQSDADCASSDDGNLCNGTLYCDLTSNTCQINPKTVVLCPQNSGNPCAPLACQPTTGECVASPVVSGNCDDGDPCTAPGSCVQGACVAGPQICQCKTQADCAVFDDANPCNGTFFCDASVGQCKANLAAVPVCPPSLDPCTQNACDPLTGGCKQTPAKAGTQCQDGEACTKNDSCQDGVCKPGVSVCACLTDADCAAKDDGDPCNGWWFCNKEVGAPECAFNPQPKAGCADVVDGPDAGGGAADTVDAADVVDVVDNDVADVQGGDVASDADVGDAADVVDGSDVEGDCAGASDGAACDDGNACTSADQCNAGTCVGSAADCDDGYALSIDSCDPTSGCKYLWPETCDGIDNDEDGTTDNVVCGSGACTCGANGVATCPADCTVCPDDGDLAIPINDGTSNKVVCAHDYPAWGVVAEAPNTFTDNGDDTVSDSKTGLMWQLTVSASTYTWANANAYCDALTLEAKKDWRLPTQFELESLVDFAKTSAPTIPAVFSGTPSFYHWSATPYQGGSSSAWNVGFSNGYSDNNLVALNFRVRCVR